MKEFKIISSTLILIVFTSLVDAARQLRQEKLVTFLTENIFLHFRIVSIDAPLCGFLEIIMTCLLSNLTNIFHCQIYFLRQAMTHNLLSLQALCSVFSQ